MVILGLTGSIGMGKTTAAHAFRRLGTPVHDADATVHALMKPGGGAVGPVGAAFSGVVRDGAVDRQALGRVVFADAAALARLEAILHPMVRRHSGRFLSQAAGRGCRLVVLDVPLLFETGGERRCDAVVVVSAPDFVQRQRVLRRPEMTPQRLAEVLARQMPDAEKRRRADFVVATGLGYRHGLRSVEKIVTVTRRWRGRHWPAPARPTPPRPGRPAPALRQRLSGESPA